MKRRGDREVLPAVRVGLVGNPNVGKSTMFNTMTGLRRHTGNWTGKTLDCATGRCRWLPDLMLVDLPGMYAWHEDGKVLTEEAQALEYLCSGEMDAAVVICDAGALERNLVLVLQLLNKLTIPVTVVVNLVGEAQAHGITVDADRLSTGLGVPVRCVEAHDKMALRQLATELYDMAKQGDVIDRKPPQMSARELAAQAVTPIKAHRQKQIAAGRRRCRREAVAERVLLGKYSGYTVMLLLLLLLLWLTMVAANGISEMLSLFLTWAEGVLWGLCDSYLPAVMSDFLFGGVVRTVFWVVAVMLPPMLIFFPLFGALEDVGYLPRMAFMLDRPLSRCHCCGKQALTMCMGLGCNSVGVTGCRIIDSPRERKLAILTNSFIPCNGRLPTLSVLISLFLVAGVGMVATLQSALWLLLTLLLSLGMTLLCSRLLAGTVLRGEPSAYLLEIPPYRRPRFGQLFLRSVLDRVVKILLRAIAVSAPAGAIIWLLSHVYLGDASLASHLVGVLETPAFYLGLDGVLLAAFLLSLPANELFLPIALMLYQGMGSMELIGSYTALREVFLAAGWDHITVICTLIFVVFHWPCATTIGTIWKESRSVKITLLSVFLPTLCGCALCGLVKMVSILIK